jgi:K+/H+ antiporter YhaU regulatory subunit KhtT
VTIVALHDFLRNEVVTAPNPDAPLKESDTLFVVGSRNDLEALGEIQ